MADFIQGDYQYTIIGENEVQIQVDNKFKDDYENIPATVTYNNNTYTITSMKECFKQCYAFNQLIVIPDSVTDLEGCFWECEDFNQPIIIPNSVTNMKSCFYGCESFNQSIIIPNSVTNMEACFYRCAHFDQPIIIPNSVTNMEACFSHCYAFNQSLVIPESVTNINHCFYSCFSLSQAIAVTTNNITAVNDCFYDTNNPTIVIANDATKSHWLLSFDYMGGGVIFDPSSNFSLVIGDYEYTGIYSNLSLSVKAHYKNRYKYGQILKQIKGTQGFTTLSFILKDMDGCFYGCTSFNQPIIIPDSVIYMNGCFHDCISFNQPIIIPDSVIYMDACFYGCTSFNQPITIPNSVNDMYSCFHDCTSFNQPITIPNSVEDMGNCFKNCTALSNNITVRGYRSNNGGLFTGTNKPIYICLGSGSESAANGWRQVAAQYPNVHFEVDDHPAPNLTLIATRGTGTGENWIPSEDGDSIKLEATWSINTEFLPYGYEVTRNNPEVFLDNNSSSDEFITNIIYKTLSTEPLNQHTFTAQLSDGYKTTTVAAIVTRVGALLDFLGNQNPKSPYVDKPGTGMAIGTLAIRSGLDIQFPTTIGEGLIPPTQPVEPELSESSSIEQGKKYYVKAGEKYYKINPESGDNPSTQGWYEATQEAVDLNNYQLTIGQYNLQDPGIQSMYGDVALIVGNGADNLHRSNAVTIGKDGLVGAYINYDTDAIRSTDATGETESQYLTRFAIINSNNNKVTYIDAHKWGHGETVGVFGAQRMFTDSPDPIQNQFGLGINNDKSLFVFMSDDAKKAWRDGLGLNNFLIDTNQFGFQGSNMSVYSINTNIDASKTNNNVSTTFWPNYQILDKSRRILTRYEGVINSNGSIGFQIYARQYNTSGTNTKQGGIAGYIAQGATVMTYSVTDPANFRSAIGAAASSDRRLKTNLIPLGKEAVQFVKELKPYSYTINNEKQIGFIAQDIYKSDKWNTHMAFETKEGIDGLDDWEIMSDGSPTWKLDYIRIIPALTAALQDSMKRIDELETTIKELKTTIEELKK